MILTGVFVGKRRDKKNIEKINTKTEVTTIARGSSIIVGMVMICSEGPEGELYDFTAEFAGILKNTKEVFTVSFIGVK